MDTCLDIPSAVGAACDEAAEAEEAEEEGASWCSRSGVGVVVDVEWPFSGAPLASDKIDEMEPDRFRSGLDGVVVTVAGLPPPYPIFRSRSMGEGGSEKEPCVADRAVGDSALLDGLVGSSAPDSAELAGDMTAEAKWLRGGAKVRGMCGIGEEIGVWPTLER